MLGIRFTSFQHNVEVSTVNASVAKDFISVFWNNFQVTKNPATKEQYGSSNFVVQTDTIKRSLTTLACSVPLLPNSELWRKISC